MCSPSIPPLDAKDGLNIEVIAGTRIIAPTMFAASTIDMSRLMSAAKRRLEMKYQKMIPPTSVEPVKNTAIPVVVIEMRIDSSRLCPRFLELAPLGVVAAALGLIGYAARKRPKASFHLSCMASSYIAMLTAFYVDNGPKLPGWRLLPPLSFWILPTLVGAPFVVLGLRRSQRARRA